jgi:hypothetical protein
VRKGIPALTKRGNLDGGVKMSIAGLERNKDGEGGQIGQECE